MNQGVTNHYLQLPKVTAGPAGFLLLAAFDAPAARYFREGVGIVTFASGSTEKNVGSTELGFVLIKNGNS